MGARGAGAMENVQINSIATVFSAKSLTELFTPVLAGRGFSQRINNGTAHAPLVKY